MDTFPARQGDPDTAYDFNAQSGTLVSVRTGADGIVRPATADEVALADAFGMRVIDAPAVEVPPTMAQLRARLLELGGTPPPKASRSRLLAAIAERAVAPDAQAIATPATVTTEQTGDVADQEG